MATIVLTGALSALLTYALVAGSPPLYEAGSVLSAPSPALLEEYSAVMSNGAPPHGMNLGDVAGALADARLAVGGRAAASEVVLEIREAADEATITVRDHRARVAALLANTVAQAIVARRNTATRAALAIDRAHVTLFNGLEATSPGLRRRIDALRAEIAILDQLRRTPGAGIYLLRPATTPSDPVGPRVGRDVVLGAVAGILLWLTLRRFWQSTPHVRRLRPMRGSVTAVY